ncbi:hypothetical protein [Brachybacterium sp. UMB0905]|uniref:hypothetical protein n=1 Tax=Brachybacterium sp. UMB0905 TaxID=2069310 RepID=UPI000C80DD3A|nr:hypothetical protein [Brachybacterium sp. UMB0905]PMC74919.1 hypothetical protein CJ197_10525 [Brachybacterium sp. UMB0905]
MIFHEEERSTTVVLTTYAMAHPHARLLIEFGEQESYIGAFDTTYESDNSGELDIEMEDPRYDEFRQVSYGVLEIIQDGPRRFRDVRSTPQKDWLTIDYRDFPTRVVDVDRGVVVYPVDASGQAGESESPASA